MANAEIDLLRQRDVAGDIGLEVAERRGGRRHQQRQARCKGDRPGEADPHLRAVPQRNFGGRRRLIGQAGGQAGAEAIRIDGDGSIKISVWGDERREWE